MYSTHLKPAIYAAFAAGTMFLLAGSAQAKTAAQQCSAKYQAAKAANELAGQTWFQFRAKCLKDQKPAFSR